MPQLQVHPTHRHWTQQLQTRGQQQAQAQGPSRTWVPSQIPQTRRRRSRPRCSGQWQERPTMQQEQQVRPSRRQQMQQLQTRRQQPLQLELELELELAQQKEPELS